MEEQEKQGFHGYPFDVCEEEGVNIIDLWRFLVQWWKFIGAITALAFLGAVGYLFVIPPVFEAKAVVLLPAGNYVQSSGIFGTSNGFQDKIFAMFVRNLKNDSLLQKFVTENPQFSSLREKKPNIKGGGKTAGDPIVVSFQGYEPKLVADWVNGFILQAEKKTIDDLSAEVEADIVIEKQEIENQLQTARDFAGRRRLDRIALLESQIAIARAAKIFDQKISGYSVVEDQKDGETLDLLQGPMYMRGVKMLVAEKEELEKRKDDEPFIAGFREKQERLAQLDAQLKRVSAMKPMIRLLKIDQPAVIAKEPIKPNRRHVLALSLVLGGAFGACVAFLAKFVLQQKKRIANNAQSV